MTTSGLEWNIIVSNEFHRPDDQRLFFSNEECIKISPNSTMLDILVMAEIFPSKGQARKNGWSAGKETIPSGWTEIVVGKLKHKFFILNPTKDNLPDD